MRRNDLAETVLISGAHREKWSGRIIFKLLTQRQSNFWVRIKRGYGCGTERIDGTDMRIKRGADMRIKRGADMRIKRGWVVFCAN